MGVHKLWEILEPAKQVLPLEQLAGQCLCIDLSCWIIQLNKVNGGNVKDKPHLRGLFHRIRALLALNCHLIFVADGSIPCVKADTYRQRLGNTVFPPKQDAVSLKRNKGSEFGRMVSESKLLVEAFGLPCLMSLEEGEAQCAALNSIGICDSCCTADSDAFLFGAGLVFRDMSLGKSGEPAHAIVYDMSKIKLTLGYGRNSLIALGILLGCDYFSGVRGLGPEKAQQLVKNFGDDKILEVMRSEGPVTLAKRFFQTSKNKAKTLQDSSSVEDDIASKAISAYLNPACHSTSSEAVQRVLDGGPVQLNELRKFCLQNFEWPFEKTDEYVLNKVAVRDVHRMASIQLPNKENEAQLQYKISNIVKMRKQQGVEHYEVEWVGVPQIPSSIVPAEILRRAYPCKVAEFNAKLATKTKRKTKPSKVAKARDWNVVMKMDNLRLEPEKLAEASERDTVEALETNDLSFDNQKDIIEIGGDSLIRGDANEVEIIDLTTPVKTSRSTEVCRISRDEDELYEVPDFRRAEQKQHEERVQELRNFIKMIKQSY